MSVTSPPFVVNIVAPGAEDVHLRLVDDLGGDASVLAFYVTTNGLTGLADDSVVHSSGVVDEWHDYRGGGFAPLFAGAGTSRPAWDAVDKEIVGDGVDDWMGTALASMFALDAAAKTLVMVGTVEGANDTHPAAITKGGGQFVPFLGMHKHVDAPNNIASQHYPDAIRLDSSVGSGATVRVVLVSKNATTTGAVEVPNQAQVTGAITAATTGDNKLVLFSYTDPGVSFSSTKMRALIVLDRAFTTGDRDQIRDWAVANLGAAAA